MSAYAYMSADTRPCPQVLKMHCYKKCTDLRKILRQTCLRPAGTQKISEYKRMRKQQSDPVFISLSTRNLIDMDEYEQQLQDLKDEIEDIRTDIEDIKYDIEDIRDEVEYELN